MRLSFLNCRSKEGVLDDGPLFLRLSFVGGTNACISVFEGLSRLFLRRDVANKSASFEASNIVQWAL